MQQSTLQKASKVVRISPDNYEKIIAKGKYGQTFDEILSKYLEKDGDKP